MAKPIQVPDDVHERLKARADKNYRSLGGEISYLLDVAEGAVQRVSEKEAPQKIMGPNLSLSKKELQEMPLEKYQEITLSKARNTQAILSDIRDIEAELASTSNQDPDYWTSMNEAKNELWAEYHQAKGTPIKNTPVADATGREQACCAHKKPCIHWSYDMVFEHWVNSLSGRVRSE